MQVDKKAENRVFQPGDTVLVRNLSGPKFGSKGDLAKVVKQIDFHSAEVQLVEGEGVSDKVQVVCRVCPALILIFVILSVAAVFVRILNPSLDPGVYAWGSA